MIKEGTSIKLNDVNFVVDWQLTRLPDGSPIIRLNRVGVTDDGRWWRSIDITTVVFDSDLYDFIIDQIKKEEAL